jgi:hypothetical protein
MDDLLVSISSYMRERVRRDQTDHPDYKLQQGKPGDPGPTDQGTRRISQNASQRPARGHKARPFPAEQS